MRPRGSATLAEDEEVVQETKRHYNQNSSKDPKLKTECIVRKGVGTRKTKTSHLTSQTFKNGQTKDLARLCYQKHKKVGDSFWNLLTI